MKYLSTIMAKLGYSAVWPVLWVRSSYFCVIATVLLLLIYLHKHISTVFMFQFLNSFAVSIINCYELQFL